MKKIAFIAMGKMVSRAKQIVDSLKDIGINAKFALFNNIITVNFGFVNIFF